MKFPDQFKENISKIIGSENISDFMEALEHESVLSIRKNKAKGLPKLFEQGEPIPWEPNGVYISQHPGFITDPEWHAGTYYVQEPSSMLLKHYVSSLPESRDSLIALDLCAAPGGKSTHLLDILSDDSFLISNEIDPQRFSILKENKQRWGRHNILLTRASPGEYSRMGECFDLILVDAPCSGEGMFRKDSQAVHHWGLNNIRICHERQKNILTDILQSLRPGGVLIYSTCTFNIEENEGIGDWLTEHYNMECVTPDTPKDWGFTCRMGKNTKVQVAYPHRVRGEGIAMQMFRKPGQKTNIAAKQNEKTKQTEGLLPEWLCKLAEHEDYIIKKQTDDQIKAIGVGAALEKIIEKTIPQKQLHWPTVGEWKGKDFIPNHTIAMWPETADIGIPKVELTHQEALYYLKGETSIVIEEENPKANWCLATYRDNALGWIKVVGTQVKNHYPKPYRIRQSIHKIP